MEDRVQKLHEIKQCLSKAYKESCDDLSDLVAGAIIGFAMADGIVSGEVDLGEFPAENQALAFIAAITLVEVMPSSALDNIGKMFSDD